MDDIKKLLGEELFTSVKEKLNGESLTLVPKGKKVFLHEEKETPVITNNGEWIPKAKFNELNEQLKSEKAMTANSIKELETLKKSVGDNAELEATINTMKLDAEKSQADNDLKFTNMTKSNLILEVLEERGAVRSNAKLLLREIPLDKVEISDGKIKDVETVLKPVIEEHKSLFGKPVLKGVPPVIPDGAPDGYITKDKFMAMTPQEQAANITKINESSVHWNKK